MITLPKINKQECSSGECEHGRRASRMMVKPSTSVLAVGISVALKVFFASRAGELRIYQGTTFSSSSPSIASVSPSGILIANSPGSATITASWEDKKVFASVTVVDQAINFPVSYEICADNSRSMCLPFNQWFKSKVDAGRRIALEFAQALNAVKDSAGLVSFSTFANEIKFVNSIPIVVTDTAQIIPSAGKTHFWPVLKVASDNISSGSGRVILIISDGRDNSGEFFRQNAIEEAEEFRSGGGIIACCGLGAFGEGYEFLQLISTDGYFVNFFGNVTADEIVEQLLGLLGQFCGGNSVNVPSEQVPSPDPHTDPEDLDLRDKYSATKTICQTNPITSAQVCATGKAVSNKHQADADEQATSMARIQSQALLNEAIATSAGYGVQAFSGGGPPGGQRPCGDGGVYFDFFNAASYPWDSAAGCWRGVPGSGYGTCEILLGVQAFAGSGLPTTQRPANGAGTYYDYLNKVEYPWDEKNNCWRGMSGTGTGAVVVAFGQQYFSVAGAPSGQVPANGAGQYFDTTNGIKYNWNGSAWD